MGTDEDMKEFMFDSSSDDLLMPLTTEEYIKFRLNPMHEEYTAHAPRLSRMVFLGKFLILVGTAASTVLGAVKLLGLVPIVGALTFFVVAAMSFESVEQRMESVNAAKI